MKHPSLSFFSICSAVCAALYACPSPTIAERDCSDPDLQGAVNIMTCVSEPQCYYDDYAVEMGEPVSCSTEKKPCLELGDVGLDPLKRGDVWGYSNDFASTKIRSLATDYCDGDTLIEYRCNEDNAILEMEEDCENGCSQGACIAESEQSSAPPATCGNGKLDSGEQCDSGALNSDNLNVASFCTKSCRFYLFNNQQLPFRCQIVNNVPATRDLLCEGHFSFYMQECTIRAGETSCVTEYPLLPQNNNEKHYKEHLTGSLHDHYLTSTAYNGKEYFLNFAPLPVDPNLPAALPQQGILRDGQYSCSDSDNGKDFYRLGRLRSISPGFDNKSDDTCVDSWRLSEKFCISAREAGYDMQHCTNGCRNGACLASPDASVSSSQPPSSSPPASNGQEKSSAPPAIAAVSKGKIPPAGFEDEVLVNYDAYENPFPDTSLADLSGKAAAELYRRAVIGGFPDGEFKGNRNVNRAEAAKFLLLSRFGDVYEMQNNGRFPDVLDGQWYTKYVVMAAEKGIISGYPDGLFRPADTVNTVEFLKMLSLTFGLQLYLPHAYTDVATTDWFAPYAGIAQKYELFPGRTMLLRPGDPLSREEVAVAIYQYLNGR